MRSKVITGHLCNATVLLSVTLMLGCAENSNSDYNASGADMDVDADMDADMDNDMEDDWSDDADGGIGVSEIEEQSDYRVPRSSGEYVFIADSSGDTVASVNSQTLVIKIVDVGARPTHLVPLNDDAEIAVINTESDNVSLVRLDAAGQADVVNIDVRPDTNALAVSNNGEYVVAFWDALFASETGPPGTDQEISVVRTTEDSEEAFHFIVGMHPKRVVFNQDSSRVFIITEEGISVIDLTNMKDMGIPPLVKMFDAMDANPDIVEIAIDPVGDMGIARRDDSSDIIVAWLDGSEERRTYTLPGVPTDLDISKDGSFGMFVLRSISKVAIFDLPFPSDPSDDPFEYVDLGDLLCGVATLAIEGKTALLYTTTAGDSDDRRVLTMLKKSDSEWNITTALVEREIRLAYPAPDDASAVVLHDYKTPGADEFGWSYSLVKLPEMQIKFEMIPIKPLQLLLTPNGDFGYLLQRDDQYGIKRVEILNLRTFIVDSLRLGSPPIAAGYAAVPDKVFISQEHPSGRMTFVNVDDGTIKTVTGYALNDEITD